MDNTPEAVSDFHTNSDLNQGPEAQHHSLGGGADQAAPGIHQHYNVVPVLPTATFSNRGLILILAGALGAADVAKICLKSAADTYSWITVATG